MKKVTASIADLKKTIVDFEVASEADPNLEGLYGKKFAAAVDLIEIKDNVTKDMKQAYNHAEKKWATNVMDNEADSCTKGNKFQKIKGYVLDSTAYKRLIKDPKTKAKVDKWIDETFTTPAEEPE
jgi:uncharacterized membrane-anchored protein YjiN (DUF445 family)